MNRIMRLTFFVLTLTVAFGVSYVVYQKMTNPQVVVKKEEGPSTIQIAVAVREMKRGDKITADDIKLSSYLEKTAPKGHFSSLESAVGRIVLSPIDVTEPILESELAPTSITKGGMAAVIGHQKRAMAVKVDNVIGVAGFLQPGNLVDVLVSMPNPENDRQQVAKTVLENIPVLSVGPQAEDSKNSRASNATVVTLEVDLDEGEKLALAVNEGRIQLALRNHTDTTPILTKGNTMESLLRSYSPEVFEPVAATEKQPVKKMTRERPRIVMEMINGNSVNRITVDK